MNINFTDPRMIMCQQEYNKLDPEERLTMSHFDLAQHTAIDDIEPWIDFLKDPRVADSINEREVSIDYKNLIGAYFNQMLSDISDGTVRSQRVVAMMKGFYEKNSFKTFTK